jgi:hypothetical protein
MQATPYGVRLPTLPDTLDTCAEHAAAYVGLHCCELAGDVRVVTLCDSSRVQWFGVRNKRCHGVSPDLQRSQALASGIVHTLWHILATSLDFAANSRVHVRSL